MRTTITYFYLFILFSLTLFAQGFVHQQGREIVDGNDQPLFLRGYGLGGWLVPEGYMLHMPGYGSPTVIRSQIVDVLGETKADAFYEAYRQNYVNEKDIELIAEWGFNSIRLPFHYQNFVLAGENTDLTGFTVVDSLISWCRQNDLYLILDMHCAPGGQNSGNISDSDGQAKLWLESSNQDLAVRIWMDIARRYVGETIIAGYDLINETVLPEGYSNSVLRNFLVRVTDSIRTIDNNHMIIAEGNWYATDFSGLTPVWDDNMAYSFHKYWSPTDLATIQYMINIRVGQNVPLWMGESGENSNPWFYEMIKLYTQQNIGWNWWTHKKFETVTSPLSAPLPEGFDELQDYWSGSGPKPSVEFAETVLMEMADNLKIEKCEKRPGVLPALLEADFGSSVTPLRTMNIPGFIPAADYDIGNEGVTYHDSDYKNTSGTPGKTGNSGHAYRNDGVDIEKTADGQVAKYNVGFIEDGEWINYSVQVLNAGNYQIKFHLASEVDGGKFRLLIDKSTALTTTINAPNTGGWQNWQVVTLNDVNIPAGNHVITFQVITGGFNIKGFDFIGFGYNDIQIEKKLEKKIRVYPNPSSGKLSLRYEDLEPTDIKFDLYNTLGQKVWSWKGSDVRTEHYYQWNLAQLKGNNIARGIYFYRVKTRKDTYSGKLIFIDREF